MNLLMTKERISKVKLPKLNIEGQVHFVTIKTFNNLKYFRNSNCCDVFLKILDDLRIEIKFKIFGFVVMPNHVHLLIISRVGSNSSSPRVGSNLFEPSKQPEANEFASTRRENKSIQPRVGSNSFEPGKNREDISYVVKRIKGASAREINKYLKKYGNFWQKDFYDFNIYSEQKLLDKLNYMHANPVRAGLVKDPSDWKYSSYQNYYFNKNQLIKVDIIF